MDPCRTSSSQRPRRVEGEQASWTRTRSSAEWQRTRWARTELRRPRDGDDCAQERPPVGLDLQGSASVCRGARRHQGEWAVGLGLPG
eukprot:11483405-Heterocapsa_arctica.AAC.1